MKALVLGGGVTGITTAYYLAKTGFQVSVVEKGNGPGLGASYANGGQLCYSGVRSMRTFPPGYVPSSKQQAFIAKHTFKNNLFLQAKEELLRLIQELNLKCYFNFSGVLNLFFSEEELKRHIRIFKNKEALGIKTSLFTTQECFARYPILKASATNLLGGILVSNDAVGDTYAFSQQLAHICQTLGVKFYYDTEIKGIHNTKSKIESIETNKGIFTSEIFIATLGAFTGQILKEIDEKNDIYPNKGYSITIPKPADINYDFSFADLSNKIYYCTLGNKIRIAGLSKAVGFNYKIDPIEINFLKHTAKKLLPSLNLEDRDNLVWTNFRSSTKSSTPIIRRSNKFQNLFINSGHGGFGWTLAPISAKVLADVISNHKQ